MEMKDDIRKIIDEFGAADLTAKTVRVKLEVVMGLHAGALKPNKDEISALIDEVLGEGSKVRVLLFEPFFTSMTFPQAEAEVEAVAGTDSGVGKVGWGGGGGEGDDELAGEAPKKKAKTSWANPKKSKTGGSGDGEGGDESVPTKPKMTCETRSGAEAPKNLKVLQEDMKMTVKKFLSEAEPLCVEVCGNTLTGEPRSFASDAMGWCVATL